MGIFLQLFQGFNIDETTTNDVESALHICARRGDWQRVELLVHSGANLALQNKSGNTPLHVVIEESLNEPSMIEDYLQVLCKNILAFTIDLELCFLTP
jgi:ankyrin repeat protein